MFEPTFRTAWRMAWLAMAAALLASCASSRLRPEDYTRARFVLEEPTTNDFSAIVTLPLSQVRIPVDGNAILSEFDYHSIEVAELELGECLLFTLKPPAARQFYQITAGNQGRRLVLLLNGQPMGARRIDAPIADGRLYMFIETGDEQLREIAENLKETNLDIQKKLSR